MMRMRAGHKTPGTSRLLALCTIAAASLTGTVPCLAAQEEVRDLKYGAILYQFYQQNYFDALVEYAYAEEKGGIHGHGSYPELLKGGVSLSYGLDIQAEDIFTRVAEGNVSEQARNRAWFYLGKMQYQRGDTERAARNLSNVRGLLPESLDAEYRYLAALVNVKLGYFEASDGIAGGFDSASPYAPYFYFNLGIAYGNQQQTDRAAAALERVVSYGSDSHELSRLSDRARMALSFLHARNGNLEQSRQQFSRIRTHGAYSNRGLLGASWLAVNEGQFGDALAPLNVLADRSIALPEVQEALLLKPHVYEQMGLDGRAAQGFIDADAQFGKALDWLDRARSSLEHADVMELFVRNLDKVLGESDWFGRAPSVSVNYLSPFLVELMSDHSFQSVLKDLRDLYAIRNNLERWKARHNDFDVILAARSGTAGGQTHPQRTARLKAQAAQAQADYDAMMNRAAALASAERKKDREKLQWQLDDLAFELAQAQTMLEALGSSGFDVDGGLYAADVRRMMNEVDDEVVRTDALIGKLEEVMQTLVSTELDIHEQRLKHYRVEAQLAKVRILDRSLLELDGSEDDEPPAALNSAGVRQGESGEGDDAI